MWKRQYFDDPDRKKKLPPGKHIKIVPARCKSYSCPVCGKKKVHDLMDKMKGLNLSKYRFFTLTLKNNYSLADSEKNIQRVNDCFNKLNNALRKKEKYKGLEYFKVIEIGKDGMVHIHGIWNKYVPVVELSAMWKTVTKDSWVVNVKRIQSKGDAVRYLFKYLTKNIARSKQNYSLSFFNLKANDSAAIFYEQGKRRFTSSRNFFKNSVKVTSEYRPLYFEDCNNKDVESVIDYLMLDYGLKEEHFDLKCYIDSDMFLAAKFGYEDSS